MSIINSPLSDADRKITGDELQKTLVDLIQLSMTAKQVHWNLVGPRFRSVHLQLDEVVALTRDHSDTVAERATAIGVNPDGRPATVAAELELPDVSDGWLNDEKGVAQIGAELRGLSRRLRERIEVTEKSDPVSQDILIQVAQDIDKQAWMFEAQQAQSS